MDLSPYGQKVLATLLYLKKERKTNNNYYNKPISNPPQRRNQNKKILSFNDSEPLRTISIFNDLNTENNERISTAEFNLQIQNNDNNAQCLISSTEDLLTTAYNNNNDARIESICPTNLPSYEYNNLLTIQASNSNSNSKSFISCRPHLGSYDSSNNEDNTSNVTNETSNDISWDNMFDSEILQYFEDADNAKSNKNEQVQCNKEFALETNEKHEMSVLECNRNDQNDKRKRTAEKANAHVKTAKVILPKKNKDKINFRKEKYTTTVKNWLNDINSTNVLADDFVDGHQNEENCNLVKKTIPVEKQTNSKPKTNNIINKEKKIKRSIQAQLANKDGVMKYKKPKYVGTDNLNTEEKHTTPAGSNNINKCKPIKESYDNVVIEPIQEPNFNLLTTPVKEHNVKEVKEKKAKSKVAPETIKEPNTKVVKEKNAKTKFIVPIKSQIAVLDVTYKVVIINNLIDITAVLCDLEKFEEDEGVMTMVYSNGFCQLNNQHTDDTCSPEGIMFYFQNTFYYIEGHVNGIADVLYRILSNNAIISFDAKSVLVYLMHQFELVPNGFNIIDTKIGACLIKPDEPAENFSEMQKLLDYRAKYTIATECTLQKVAWYMTLLKDCSNKLKSLLLESGLWKVFVDIEMKILPIMAGMEYRGISVDMTKLKSMEDILLTRIKEIESLCHKAAGKVFQINSTVQVRALIYDELKLDATSNIKIRETICKGAKSTSEAMLRSLVTVHPLPKLILEYRHLHKAHATFLAGIAQHVRDGVVKPTWDQTAAATGRIASNNPNLQAIPKMPFNLVLFPKDDDKDLETLNFRTVYVARAGYVLLAADFKHIECRVFAQAAADSGLLAALESPDLFRVLAAKWLSKAESDVSGEDRERTKRIVYASLYGAGTRKLMEILNLGYDQVLSIMSSFNRTFPSLKSFGRSVVAQCCRQEGRLSTASGRARTFKNITSSDFQAKSHAERQAVNFIIQGTAADLCKVAMVHSAERLRESSPPVQAHLLLQIHDELVWEVLDQHLDIAAAIIKNAMESSGQVFGMARTLPIAMYKGTNWGEMVEFFIP